MNTMSEISHCEELLNLLESWFLLKKTSISSLWPKVQNVNKHVWYCPLGEVSLWRQKYRYAIARDKELFSRHSGRVCRSSSFYVSFRLGLWLMRNTNMQIQRTSRAMAQALRSQTTTLTSDIPSHIEVILLHFRNAVFLCLFLQCVIFVFEARFGETKSVGWGLG